MVMRGKGLGEEYIGSFGLTCTQTCFIARKLYPIFCNNLNGKRT